MSSIIYLATHPTTPRSIYLFTIPIHPLISPFTPHPPTHTSIYSPFHPQIPSPIHSFTHYPPIHLPINPSIHLLSTHPSIHSSINALLPIQLLIHLPTIHSSTTYPPMHTPIHPKSHMPSNLPIHPPTITHPHLPTHSFNSLSINTLICPHIHSSIQPFDHPTLIYSFIIPPIHLY